MARIAIVVKVMVRVRNVLPLALRQECDYKREAECTLRFKQLLSGYPEFSVPAVVGSLSSSRVLTTEWMEGLPIDKAAKQMPQAERDRVGARLLWLSLKELAGFRFMQTDPNWSNFLYEGRTGQISLIDFGASVEYEPSFSDEYLRLVVACAEGEGKGGEIIERSIRLGFLTGEESEQMVQAHVSAAALVGEPFSEGRQPFNFGQQEREVDGGGWAEGVDMTMGK